MSCTIWPDWCITKGSVEDLNMTREGINLDGATLDFIVRDIINDVELFSGSSDDSSPASRIEVHDVVTADITIHFSNSDTNLFTVGRRYKTDIRVTPASGEVFYYIGLEWDVTEAVTR